jgi:hypothetical protein
MNYAYSVGFDIINFADYSQLTDGQKASVRAQLFASVQSIIEAMGVFDVEDPTAKMTEILAEASSPGAEWSLGKSLVRGWIYVTNPVTNEVECIRTWELMREGLVYQVQVDEANERIGAVFQVSYSAENGPY